MDHRITKSQAPKKNSQTSLLREWAAELANIPLWLFEDAYHTVGDLAEAIALVIPKGNKQSNQSLSDWIREIKSLQNLEEKVKKKHITEAWNSLNHEEKFVFNKLITGGFRMGVSQKLMTRALAQHTGLEENELAHKLMGNWKPDEITFEELIFHSNTAADASKPYPFYLAYTLEDEPATLGSTEDWYAERKWDGIRGQIIIRNDEVFIWSRGEELVNDRFPEFKPLADQLPNGTVLDGEIIPIKNGIPLAFGLLQKRIGRKSVGKKLLVEVPIHLIAYDLLELGCEDLRNQPISERREKLEKLLQHHPSPQIHLSEIVEFSSWNQLAEIRENARQNHCEGLMLKRKDSIYQVGRKKETGGNGKLIHW